jgi:ABC-type phosphate/phosphonate transport system substrate-binding protein
MCRDSEDSMSISSIARSVAVMAVSALLVGCAGTTWSQVQTSSGYQAPKQAKVVIVVQANGEGLAEAVAELKASLASELSRKGITATFVQAPDGTPMTEMTVAEWDPGSRGLRWLGFGGGEGHVIVIVKSPTADGQPGYSGTARGYVKSGWFGGSSLNSASEAGAAIADAIATGKAE